MAGSGESPHQVAVRVDADANPATVGTPPVAAAPVEPPKDRAADEAAIHDALAARDFRAAVTTLMKLYGQPVYRYCRQMLGDAARADDVHQQVFIEAYRDLPGFAGRSSLRTWVFGIARHRCLDALKSDRRWNDRYKQDEPGDPPDAAPAAGARIDDARLVDALAQCIDTLAPATRMVVLLRYQEGFTFEQMADICRERAGTLQQRVARAMPVLRACIEQRTGGQL